MAVSAPGSVERRNEYHCRRAYSFDYHQNLLQQPVVQDVLRSLTLNSEQVLNITFEQLAYLQVNHKVSYWLLSQNASENDRTLSLPQPLNVWQSGDLEEFKQHPQAKRQLWQTIQQSPSINAE